MADKREIYTRARMMTSAAQLGGRHLKEANRDLKDLQNTFTVAEYNALLLAIRMYNLADRKDNLHLPKLIFAACLGGAVPDSIVAHHDTRAQCSPETETFIRSALAKLGHAAAPASETITDTQFISLAQDEYLTFTNESLLPDAVSQ